MSKAITYHGLPTFVSPAIYKQIEDGIEVLQLSCGVCGKNLVKLTNDYARALCYPSRGIGEIFCAECAKYKGPKI